MPPGSVLIKDTMPNRMAISPRMNNWPHMRRDPWAIFSKAAYKAVERGIGGEVKIPCPLRHGHKIVGRGPSLKAQLPAKFRLVGIVGINTDQDGLTHGLIDADVRKLLPSPCVMHEQQSRDQNCGHRQEEKNVTGIPFGNFSEILSKRMIFPFLHLTFMTVHGKFFLFDALAPPLPVRERARHVRKPQGDLWSPIENADQPQYRP